MEVLVLEAKGLGGRQRRGSSLLSVGVGMGAVLEILDQHCLLFQFCVAMMRVGSPSWFMRGSALKLIL